MNRKIANKKIATSVILNFIDKLNYSDIDEVSYALDILETTLDEKMSIIKHLNSAAANASNIITNKGDFSKHHEKVSEAQDFLKRIDNCLFSMDYEGVTINFKDYQECFIKHSSELGLHTRYEPVTEQSLLKIGVAGFLKEYTGGIAKPINFSREVEQGKIIARKEF